ncbi:hypothetical protein V8G54_036452 [Vigna mungo]|uniref:Uncharacterized protein n=1 Tax=Vigna mungo TaxID=3915 RepID=A0AAQ3MHP2_VIGMU
MKKKREGRISDEDIRGKLLSLRKIKIVVSHTYLKLVRVFYSNIKMSDETFCSTVKGVDIKQVYPISESWSANKTDLTNTEEGEWAKWYVVKINCMSESLKRFLGLRIQTQNGFFIIFLKRKSKATNAMRNVDPFGWISDDETREVFLRWKRVKTVVSHRYLNLDLFRREDLVEVFYTNLRDINEVIHSRVKGVNIYITDNVWLQVAGLKAEGLHSHVRKFETNMWLKKAEVYRNWLRFPGRYTIEILYVHDGLNKEKKMTAHILAWLILPGRILQDRMTTKHVFLFYAIKNDIPSNWVQVIKDHMIEGEFNQARTLPYGVLISKILTLQGVDVTGERKVSSDISNAINKMTLTSIGLVKTMNGWCFKDKENMVASSGSSPALNEDRTSFIPRTNFESFVVEQFKKGAERDMMLEKKVDVLFQREINNNPEIEDSDEESTKEDWTTSESE